MTGELPMHRLPTHPGVIIREEYLQPMNHAVSGELNTIRSGLQAFFA
jgi:hypothetical protein